jgi:hypothetical protein
MSTSRGPLPVALVLVALLAAGAAVFLARGGRDGGVPAPEPAIAPATPPAVPPPAPAPAPARDPLEEKIGALRALLGREPVDFGAARALGEEIRKAGGGTQVLGELQAQWRAAAAEIAARKEKEARAAFDAGGPEAWRRVLLDWPAGFADAPEAVAMARKVEEVEGHERKVGEMVDRHLGNMEKELASLDPSAATAAADLARIDHDLKMFQDDPLVPEARRRRAGELRAKAAGLAAAAAKAGREAAAARAWGDLLGACNAWGSFDFFHEGCDEVLRESRGTRVGDLLTDLLAGSGRVEDAANAALSGTVGHVWAYEVDGYIVGRGNKDSVIPARWILGPVQVTTPSGPRSEVADLLRIAKDPADAACWLLAEGWPLTARSVAGGRGPVAELLSLPGSDPLLDVSPAISETTDWPGIVGLSPSPPGPVPAAARRKKNPSKDAAIAGFLGDDLAGAMASVTDAIDADRGDAEVWILHARVLDAFARPFPTMGISISALSSARHAWDLEPALAGSPALFAELALAFRLRYPGPMADELTPAAIRACEASMNQGRETSRMLLFLAERRKEAGDLAGAKSFALRAKRLGAALPRWAEDLLE